MAAHSKSFWQRMLGSLQRSSARLGLSPVKIEPSDQFEPGLGIQGLPSGVGLLPLGAPVALLLKDAQLQHKVLQACLCELLTGGSVFVVGDETQFLDEVFAHDHLQQALREGRLRVTLMHDDMVQHVAHYGLEGILREMRRKGLDRQTALMVLGASALIEHQSVLQLQRLGQNIQRWSARRKRPVVWAFPGLIDSDDMFSRLYSMGATFRNLAILGRESSQLRLYVDRWDGPQGAVFRTHYGLRYDENNQRLEYDGHRTQGASQQVMDAPDQYDVIPTLAAIAGQRGVPTHWKSIAHWDDALAATQRCVAGTLLLDAGGMDDFERLARLVHELRLSRPRTMKIVVRETQGKLRSNMEQALLHLGVNVVVYREVGFSRLLQLLQEVSVQTFTRDIAENYEQALGGFVPEPVHGYLEPARFCDTVASMLQRSQEISLSHCMVRLPVLPQVPHLDAVRAFRAKRDGDLMTADANSLYVFLFACREPDVEAALVRLFTAPVAQLFSSQITDGSLPGIQAMLEGLHTAMKQGLPDYSVYIQTQAPAPEHANAVAPKAASAPAGSEAGSAATPQVSVLPAGGVSAPHGSPVTPQVEPHPIGRQASWAGGAS